MKKIIIPIQGMHCRSCEIIIEGELSKINGIKKAKSNFGKGVVEIDYEFANPDMGRITEAIEKAGYKVEKKGDQPFLSKDIKDYRDLSVAFLFLVIIYFIAKRFGIVDLNLPKISSNFPMILLVGVTAGVSTCMALVGGLVLSFSARHSEKHPEASGAENFRPHLFFNLGRFLGFGILGGFLGIVGSVFQLSAFTTGLISVFIGFVMLVMGFQLIEIFPRVANWKITFPKKLSGIFGIGRHQKEYSHKGVFIAGALTFFLPCGFTHAMQLLAVESGSFVSGAMVMAVFALGTAPGLLGIGGLTSFMKKSFAGKFFKFAGLAVIFFSLFNISNGYKLLGLNFNFQNFSGNEQNQISEIKTENGFQIIEMAALNGYFPNQFTVKNGIPVKWIINVKNPYTCAASFMVPKLGIRRVLNVGENIIEFIPEETGKINFSCSMGMYTGVINVVD
ncbi:hypothetical protein A3J77_01960 [Candidatus Wolfebacteria bacterium RBG_13_41_7]|uniref:HMA domain-containing protein n=1 Tax=Candidatus Wolfebacteria bacterium RBG_13_41_7 TaxID=1802554 RepID=A0A1F8DLX0_9BACT|nr:MAG: hypothetical protein A3J77_01960 [Candidatus Wolfebacteria bacterium RBG_13_41_7]